MGTVKPIFVARHSAGTVPQLLKCRSGLTGRLLSDTLECWLESSCSHRWAVQDASSAYQSHGDSHGDSNALGMHADSYALWDACSNVTIARIEES